MLLYLFFVSLLPLFSCFIPKKFKSQQEREFYTTCSAKSFAKTINFFIDRGIRWADLDVKHKELRVARAKKLVKRVESLYRKYCAEDGAEEEQVYGLDVCFSIAYKVDIDIVVTCRKKHFYTPSHLKDNECSSMENQEDELFRACINKRVRIERKDMTYDVYEGLTRLDDLYVLQMQVYTRKKPLACLEKVLG